MIKKLIAISVGFSLIAHGWELMFDADEYLHRVEQNKIKRVEREKKKEQEELRKIESEKLRLDKLRQSARSIIKSARIVDTFCDEMSTPHTYWLEICFKKPKKDSLFKKLNIVAYVYNLHSRGGTPQTLYVNLSLMTNEPDTDCDNRNSFCEYVPIEHPEKYDNYNYAKLRDIGNKFLYEDIDGNKIDSISIVIKDADNYKNMLFTKVFKEF